MMSSRPLRAVLLLHFAVNVALVCCLRTKLVATSARTDLGLNSTPCAADGGRDWRRFLPDGLVALTSVANNATTTAAAKTWDGELSWNESLYFMADLDADWHLRKLVHIAQMEIEKLGHLACDGCPGYQWYQYHYEPTFHCAFAQRLGPMGDGGKWVCDPHRIAQGIAQGATCLVYSIGSPVDYSFEQSLHRSISPACEVHAIDQNRWEDYGSLPMPAGVNHHVYTVGHTLPAKTLPAIAAELGHAERRIEILKIDCNGCEWTTFRDWFGPNLNVRQILVTLHGVTRAHELFTYLFSQGYVVFHKESNTYSCGGNCIEYGFLKLAPSFSLAS